MNTYRIKDEMGKEINTLFGLFHYRRISLRPTNASDRAMAKELFGKSKGEYPLDEGLKIDNIPFKISPKALACVVEAVVRDGSYNAAKNFTSLKIDKESRLVYAQKFTAYAGELIFERERTEALKALDVFNSLSTTQNSAEPDYGEPDTVSVCSLADYGNESVRTLLDNKPVLLEKDSEEDRLYLVLGTSHIHTREGAGEKREYGWDTCLYAISFKESDVEYFYDEEGRVQAYEVKKREVTAFYGKAPDFTPFIISIMLKTGYDGSQKLVIITDGSDYAECFAGDFFPDAVSFVKYGADRECADDSGSVLIKKTGANPVESWNSRTKKPYSFLYEKQGNTDYDDLQKHGIFIGAGAVDVSKDPIVGEGLRIPPRNLKAQSIQAVLSVYALYHSGRFNELVPLIENCN